MKPDGRVTINEFPHGLRCAECSSLIPASFGYWQRAEAMCDDALVVVLICTRCHDRAPL